MDDKTRAAVQQALSQIRPAGDAAVILERVLWEEAQAKARAEPTLPNPNVEIKSGMSVTDAAAAIGAQLRGWTSADDAIPHVMRVITCMRACREADAEVRAADETLRVTSEVRSSAAKDLHAAQQRAAERWQELHDLARGT